MRTVELTVLCEGQTERNFVTLVLGPYLRDHDVFARSTTLTARPSVSGVVSFDKMRRAIQNDLGRRRDHQYVTTMVDLYGLRDFPQQAARIGESVYDRVVRIESAMAAGLPGGGFIPYVQIHEFEALVLVDLEHVLPSFPDTKNLAAAMKRLRREIGNVAPEEIDDGVETAPSRRLVRHIPEYDRSKPFAGPAICERIGIGRLKADCPHFGQWIERLESLAHGTTV